MQPLYKATHPVPLMECKLITEKIDRFAHIIWRGRLKFAECSTDITSRLKYPTTQAEVCSYIRFCNVCREFVMHFMFLYARFNKKLRKDLPK